MRAVTFAFICNKKKARKWKAFTNFEYSKKNEKHGEAKIFFEKLSEFDKERRSVWSRFHATPIIAKRRCKPSYKVGAMQFINWIEEENLFLKYSLERPKEHIKNNDKLWERIKVEHKENMCRRIIIYICINMIVFWN